MNVKWADFMPEGGRLPESKRASQRGKALVADPKMSCPQTLHVTLFFDGTNNNDAEDNKIWRDSKVQAHTNVARLFNAAIDKPANGMFAWYIPGVGTPFPKIGETTYSRFGKAIATGFDNRCVWAYTRLLNSTYSAIASNRKQLLIGDDQAKQLCDAYTSVTESFKPYLHRLDVAHKQAVDEGRQPQTVCKIWVNVIGFSRGAAEARAFIHKLINEWAPGGRLGTGSGKYALPYCVNFVGLFDTVAAVGPPDSVRSIFNTGSLAGHSSVTLVGRFAGTTFAADGAMNIPKEVRYCHHAFSIHEQRMAFALDSIRLGAAYSDGYRVEVAYPGVHSDVGGGYGPGEQGKACGKNGKGLDCAKLSQIPLHDMYIVALNCGVPLMSADDITNTPAVVEDFKIDPATITAFNAWRSSVHDIKGIEDAMQFGMGQLLAWRTLRAQIGTGRYVTEQPFYQRAQEDALSPIQLQRAVEQATTKDSKYQDLDRPLHQLPPKTVQTRNEIEAAKSGRVRELAGEIAHPHAAPGPRPNASRPGEDPSDMPSNDKRDLRAGAEEMRLLLSALNPAQRQRWEVETRSSVLLPSVARAAPSDSPRMRMVERGAGSGVDGLLATYRFNPDDDFMLRPVENVLPFMREKTSDTVVEKFSMQHDVVAFYDDFVHDSRCWFKVPWFREYAPGGYFWPRVVFIGNDERCQWLGFDPIKVALDLNLNGAADFGVDANRQEYA